MQIYEYAILKNEKRDRDGEVVSEAELLVTPTWVLAADESQAQLIAGRAIPDHEMNDLDRLVVVVRPF